MTIVIKLTLSRFSCVSLRLNQEKSISIYMSIKIHRPLVQAIVGNIDLIFNQNKQANRVVEHAIKDNKKWGSRDRNFVAEHTYGVVRWWRKLLFAIDIEISQSEFTETERWKVLGVWLISQGVELPQWPEFGRLDVAKITEKLKAADEIRKIKESIPDWLDDLGESEVPNWSAELTALNKEASVYLRVNTLKTNADSLIAILAEEDIPASMVVDMPDTLTLVTRKNLKKAPSYLNGLYEVQDAGSQLIADFMDAKPGMHIIDACAGAGGKTLSLACKMENKGKLTALEVEPIKLKELKLRADRNGVKIIDTERISKGVLKKLELSADRLLLDVPCSGTGVLKRNPDAKWKLSTEFIESLVQTQADILEQYTRLLKPGGQLVYATCSVLKSENEDQVQKFLTKHPNYSLIEEKRVSAAETGFDGFYMALIQKQ